MKKKFLTIASLSLVGVALAIPSFNSIDAHAEEHTHSYVGGACTCGARLFEAEDAIIEGENTNNEEPYVFIWDSVSTNPNHPTSGGKDVEYWAAAGNTLTWKFSLDKQLKDINIRFWIATGQVEKSTTGLAVTTNGVKGKWTTKRVLADDSWSNFQEVDGTLSFAQGNNEVVLTNKGANAFNIDCVEIYFPNDVVFGDFVNGDPLGEVPQDDPIAPASPLDPITSSKYILMEGEYATEVIGTPGNEADYFFENSNTTSGGANIANFGENGDNLARWEFNTNKAVSVANISIYLNSNATGIPWDEIMIPRINGGSGGAAPFSKYPQDPNVKGIAVSTINNSFVDFETYTKLDLPAVQLVEGKNVFEIESFNGRSVNIDYIEIKTEEDVEFTFTPVNNGFGGKAGPKFLEAETALVEGTSSDSHGESMILSNVVSNNTEHPTSSNGCVGNFGRQGNTITWTFKATTAVSECEIELWVAGCGNGGLTEDIISFTVNDIDVEFDDDFPAYPGNNQWYFWTSLTTKAELVQGTNTIVLTNLGNNPFNVDGVYLKVPTTCTIISGPSIDTIAPEISMITIKTQKVETYSTVEFEYTYSDDVTKTGELSVSVNVYYAYVTVNQEKLNVTGNSFVPTKVGDYTIIVSVEDKAGNIATRKRVLRVRFEGTAPEVDEDDPFGAATGAKFIDPRVTGGWITFGVCLGVSALLGGTMIFLLKKRRA